MLPNDIENSIRQDFHFPEKMVFGQIATQAENCPRVRTVRLYGIEEDKGLVFATHTASRKWNELKHNPNMAVCFLHPEYQIQLRAECTVSLLNFSLEPHLAENCWKMIGKNVKKIYDDYGTSDFSYKNQQPLEAPKDIPDCFGLIIAVPYIWEYLSIDPDYPNSIRYLYTQDADKNWERKRSAVI